MSSSANFFLKKTLGEDFLQSLEKFELWKPGTRTVIDHEEIKTALKIVPRTIMSLLINHLTPMKIGETKEIEIPSPNQSPSGCKVRVTKHERDVYSGELEEDNKRVVDFKNRSIPGVGLVIMSALELYDVEELSNPKKHEHSQDLLDKVQKMIDERLALHDLIGKVVEKKIAERDAVQQLILAKLSENIELEKKKENIIKAALSVTPTSENCPIKEIIAEKPEIKLPKKGSPLKDFLAKREQKIKKNEYPIQLAKGEHINCPDCGKDIFDGNVFSACICYGDDMDKKLYITKSEGNIKVRFGRGWDPENIEMLLEVLRKRNG